jgi:hypothetical protein
MKVIKLGSLVRDMVSGFTGIATSRTEYLNGCVQYGIRAKIGADGKMPESWNLDVEVLEVVGEGIAIETRPGGGPPARISGCYQV